ncbi:hypothetical protein ASE23_25890 [Rhizobium sp. Root73]|uniref:hypothetical protein n=1 Tax=unclassified Rhizobium TaxID=2613769 RepID=UPI0007285205|nr:MULTISPECIES: hypothetical protein [unclassified Rhizobium]KQY14931.1 hypothetical protein ASD36_25355 [Rhizobium sp. Root1334]KRC06370.1 hypothetical protein ASE23_25890 [Rhizobium sp. Root73]
MACDVHFAIGHLQFVAAMLDRQLKHPLQAVNIWRCPPTASLGYLKIPVDIFNRYREFEISNPSIVCE